MKREEVKAVPRRYFCGEGAEAQALIEQGRALGTEHTLKIDAFQRRHGADATSKFGNGTVHALAWRVEQDETPADRPGLKFVGRDDNTHDEIYHLYQPDKRTTQGKAIAAEARAIGAFNLSTWIVAQLGAARSVIDNSSPRGLLLRSSFAGARNGRLLLCVPADQDEPFTPAPWLREIPKSTFIAYSEE